MIEKSQGSSRLMRMRALVYDQYGLPDVLRIEEVEMPIPKEHEVLIAVHAASLNAWDWDRLTGKPFANRIDGLRKPRYRILGADVAGRVVSVGTAVNRLRPGDEVFGDLSGCGWGGFAEYVCASEDALTLKPDGISFEQAAAIPQAAVLALQGLRKQGELKKGHHVLINGAGGGVGTFAIQYIKLQGAEVTGVDSAEKLDLLRSVGADHVLDYRTEDFTAGGPQYDLILDVVGHRSVLEVKRALRPGGTYVMIGGTSNRIIQAVLTGPFLAWFTFKKVKVLLHKPSRDDQMIWKSLVETGQVVPIIDRQFAFDDAIEAFNYYQEGRVKGKIVISMTAAR